MRGQRALKVYVALVTLVALMVATAVLGGKGGVFSRGESLPPSLAVDRIAFVDLDRRVRTAAPNGLGDVLVSPEGDERFAWPTDVVT